MEGSTADRIYRGPAISSFAAGGAATGASTSDTNLEEERVCEGYETDKMKLIHDEDSDNESIRYPCFNPEDESSVVITKLMEFESLEQFKNVVKELNIFIGSEVDFVKNDNERVRVLCIERDVGGKGKRCPWVILCSENKASKLFQVKTLYSKHTCARRMTNKLAIREWIAPKLILLVRIQPDITGQVAYDYMIHEYRVKMNDAMVSRALKLAHEICEGQENEQYAKLRNYANELLKRNHGSTIGLQCTPYTHEFYIMYI
ncbi:hypothetical protein CRG98_048041 [Punica granatum]|uniref:Uncharacterized protein n=1 Tax=Punica granatum TaxID=22663 RepID=A0A2I0HIM2_PUNGR|nr:hypothetical protein CRG98_048041 [Punica granatum]